MTGATRHAGVEGSISSNKCLSQLHRVEQESIVVACRMGSLGIIDRAGAVVGPKIRHRVGPVIRDGAGGLA